MEGAEDEMLRWLGLVRDCQKYSYLVQVSLRNADTLMKWAGRIGILLLAFKSLPITHIQKSNDFGHIFDPFDPKSLCGQGYATVIAQVFDRTIIQHMLWRLT